MIIDIAIKSKNEIFIYLSKITNILFPNFEALNTKDYIWTFSNFSNIFLFSNFIVGIMYIIVLLIFTNLIFSKKEFE